jgi:hypothetical protein
LLREDVLEQYTPAALTIMMQLDALFTRRLDLLAMSVGGYSEEFSRSGRDALFLAGMDKARTQN